MSVSLFDQRAFLRPDPRRRRDAARGRRQGWPSRHAPNSAATWPRLDGGEHGVRLPAVGTRSSAPSASQRVIRRGP
jgi:hypothetical protein